MTLSMMRLPATGRWLAAAVDEHGNRYLTAGPRGGVVMNDIRALIVTRYPRPIRLQVEGVDLT